MCISNHAQSIITQLGDNEKLAYKSYSTALYLALTIPIIVSLLTFILFLFFAKDTTDETIKVFIIAFGITAIAISIVSPCKFLSERRRDYEMKRNTYLCALRKNL